MIEDSGLRRFMRSAFGSIWSLELLLALRQRRDHRWSHDELIHALRASEQVLTRSTADLAAAGLIEIDEEGRVRYAPASPELDETVAAVAALYASRPGKVRRLIVRGAGDSVASFADAFRFRREQGE